MNEGHLALEFLLFRLSLFLLHALFDDFDQQDDKRYLNNNEEDQLVSLGLVCLFLIEGSSS